MPPTISPISAGTEFRRQNMTSNVDPRIERAKQIIVVVEH